MRSLVFGLDVNAKQPSEDASLANGTNIGATFLEALVGGVKAVSRSLRKQPLYVSASTTEFPLVLVPVEAFGAGSAILKLVNAGGTNVEVLASCATRHRPTRFNVLAAFVARDLAHHNNRNCDHSVVVRANQAALTN